ncbi:MAG: hypothetical protein JWQ81_5030 [Amycolatopsis sp.]|nr:hypothetical protein [Amycolatopsis sp.]
MRQARGMKPLPLPLRVAAGLAVSTAERVRELPKQITGFPVTVVSQVLQLSMRVQQHVTELAIKGDEVLSALRPVEDTPSWATFDEDVEPDLSRAPKESSNESSYESPFSNVTPITGNTAADVPSPRAETNGRLQPPLDPFDGDPWAEEERALAQDHEDGEFDSADSEDSEGGPAALPNYDQLTLPQLRARLRRLSLEELEELLAYERAHADRPSFVGMLSRRIGNVNKAVQDDSDGSTGQ